MQFQVPQFIETEDKIVGPFTIRQFVYILIAGIFCFFFYFTVKLWLFVALSVVFLGTAFALGSIQVSGRALPHVLGAAFNFYWRPRLYLFQPEHELAPKRTTLPEAAPTPVPVKPKEIAAGKALRSAWQKLQTGNKMSNQQFLSKTEERYEIFQKITGDRRAAKRIDYR